MSVALISAYMVATFRFLVVDMNKPSLMLNISLLKTHPAFRAVFVARFLSILALGLLAVAVPVQIQALTGSSFQVGLAVTLAGGGMFVGLLAGGVMADRHERRRLILFARSTCGLGFIGLCVNALLPTPSLAVIYVLSVWDGFFGAVGVTALLAATPALVGRENIMQAGALSMLTVRFGAILSPAVGGAIIAGGGVVWNYGLAALGTLLTLLPLLRLPHLAPPPQPKEHPLRSLAVGFRFVLQHPMVGMVALIGALLTMTSAVRVLYPALASTWHISAGRLGMMYSAVPLGAAIGAFTSGRITSAARPGRLLLTTAVAAFIAVGSFSLQPYYWLALLCLAGFGYFSALNSLLQYALIQQLTPDELLGRVNGLWTAQNVTGDAFGALIVGGLGTLIMPVPAAAIFGLGAAGVGLILAFALRTVAGGEPEIKP